MRKNALPLLAFLLLTVACNHLKNPSQTQNSVSVSSSSLGIKSETSSSTVFPVPLANGEQRILKKPFGTYVTPESSPVQPERFKGYHTGTDFEILPGEENTDIPVRAVLGGRIVFAGWVKGYGGVVVEGGSYQSRPVTVLYGHLKITSVKLKPGDEIMLGETIAVLGKGFSTETDGERKHLHLAVHLGEKIDFRGYVSTPDELKQWINAYPSQ
jgi:murein DD-endopeptidase MepM/ murein hydrolase activator NlpD